MFQEVYIKTTQMPPGSSLTSQSIQHISPLTVFVQRNTRPRRGEAVVTAALMGNCGLSEGENVCTGHV